jgi:hypothetical protein
MKANLKTTIILIAFIAIATLLYPIILGNTAAYLIPAYSHLPKNRYLLVTCMTLGSAFGASLCALILAFPLGYLTKNHPLWLGCAFGVLVAGIKFILFPALFEQFNWFVGTIAIGEDLAFIVASMFFTWWGCQFATDEK